MKLSAIQANIRTIRVVRYSLIVAVVSTKTSYKIQKILSTDHMSFANENIILARDNTQAKMCGLLQNIKLGCSYFVGCKAENSYSLPVMVEMYFRLHFECPPLKGHWKRWRNSGIPFSYRQVRCYLNGDVSSTFRLLFSSVDQLLRQI